MRCLLSVLVLSLACLAPVPLGAKAQDPAAEITQVEERLLAMAPTFATIKESITNGEIDRIGDHVFPSAPIMEPTALGDPTKTVTLPKWNAHTDSWKIENPPVRRYTPGDTRPLEWLAALIPATGEVKIKTYDGELVPRGDTFAFRTHHKILVKSAPGEPMAEATAEVKLDWGTDGKRFLIIRWELLSAKLVRADQNMPVLATEVLEAAVPAPGTYAELRECRHETYLRAMFKNPLDIEAIGIPGYPISYLRHITTESGEQHPGVSVVDINNDGFDDLYVMRRWGKNRLLVNQGDGTFAEESERYGLDIKDVCSCAIFFDMDNDGDQDVFIGRTLERSMLLQNTDGKFEDVAHQVHGARLPFLVSSVAAADYDMDGLVDLYIGTYFGHTQGRKDGWQEEFLELEDRAEHAERAAANTDLFYDFAAPPNLLLRNRGDGRFERAPENAQVRLWRATLQPTFADWDDDGDPDLLVTNDFGPDVMLRNDPGENGERRFVDVTAELAPDVRTNYFGMGGSWGDYNNDGNLDLYLSAMYSKAGTRITNRLEGYAVRARQSALGNLLLAGGPDGSLTTTSGQGPGQHPVDQVGWAWGAQFFDPDNDGHLDLYAPTGYFTPPPEHASEVDF